MGLAQLRHGLGCRKSFVMEDKALLYPWFTPCTDMSFSTSKRTLKQVLFLPPLKRQWQKQLSWGQGWTWYGVSLHLPSLLSAPCNYHGVFTVSQPHPKDASWQGTYSEKVQAGAHEEVTELGMQLQRQLSLSGLRWHLSTPSLLHILMYSWFSKERSRDRQ